MRRFSLLIAHPFTFSRETPSLSDRLRSVALRVILPVIGLLFLNGCTSGTAPNIELSPTVILISFDGFRADYMQTFQPPNLTKLADEGVYARDGMISSFPTKTFPNHYAIATGLYPDHNGIVANSMFDPILNRSFSIRDRAAIEDSSWWEGEPVWVTAEKQGQLTAAYFWVGTEAPIEGIQPTYWYRYDGSVPDEDRVDQVFSWLSRPVEERPTFISLYFSGVDDAGHRFSPDASETGAAVAHVDALVGRLRAGLESRGLLDQVDIITVADHGMSALSPDRVVVLEDYINLDQVEIVTSSPVVSMNVKNDDPDAVVDALRKAPHIHAYRKGDIPERLHYGTHRRVPDIVSWVDDGWSIVETHQYLNENRDRYTGGNHGYDNKALSMRALFIARGPSFQPGMSVPPFENVDVYDLVTEILGLDPAPNDGHPDTFKSWLRK